jgi:hypothetical protein
MMDRPSTPDRGQQRRDNLVSRRQSGLDPLPRDLEEEDREGAGVQEGERDPEREKGRDPSSGAEGVEPDAETEADRRANEERE